MDLGNGNWQAGAAEMANWRCPHQDKASSGQHFWNCQICFQIISGGAVFIIGRSITNMMFVVYIGRKMVGKNADKILKRLKSR